MNSIAMYIGLWCLLTETMSALLHGIAQVVCYLTSLPVVCRNITMNVDGNGSTRCMRDIIYKKVVGITMSSSSV